MNRKLITPAALLIAAALATSPGAFSAAASTTTAPGDGVIVWTQARTLKSADVTGQLLARDDESAPDRACGLGGGSPAPGAGDPPLNRFGMSRLPG